MSFDRNGIKIKEAARFLGVSAQYINKLINELNIDVPKEKNFRIITPEIFETLLIKKGCRKYKGIVSITCIKGGVGKTTLTNAIGTKLSDLGHRVLLIDLDLQANLTTSFNIEAPLGEMPTFLDAHKGSFRGTAITAKDTILKISDYLHIIPANLGLTSLDNELAGKAINYSTYIKDILRPVISNYDVVLIDTPPSLNKVTSAVHANSDKIIIPINPDRFSYEGLELTVDSAINVAEKFNVKPSVHVLINKFDNRSKLAKNLLKSLNSTSNTFHQYVTSKPVAISKSIDNAIANRDHIWDSQYTSTAHDDLIENISEIFGIENWALGKKAENDDILPSWVPSASDNKSFEANI